VIWLFSSALVIMVAIALSWQAASQLLRHEIHTDAREWLRDLEADARSAERMFADASSLPSGLRPPSFADALDAVIFYRLVDRDGETVYQSALPNDGLPFLISEEDVERIDAVQNWALVEQPIVDLGESAEDFRAITSAHARILMPVGIDQGREGTAEIYLDQSEKVERYRQSFIGFATGLVLLILFAMALPMIMVWRKTKERELAERRLHDMAHTDPLTSLANRTEFRERLKQALAEADEHEHATALFWLDLDRFKRINDALGHPIGDTLLCQVARRLRRGRREHDTVARLGGDEFALLQTDCRDEREAAELAEHLINVLAVPFDVDGHHVVIGVSIGIVFAPRDGHRVDDLLKKADIALYKAKDSGRSTYRFFRPDMEARSAVRHVLEEDLRVAINNNALQLHYQPQVSLRTGQIVGFEALLRWHHPRYGHMPPHEVVALAEETGLIVPLGFWALRQATADATTWPDDITVSVNISAVQFRHTNLVDLVDDALRMSGLSPERLDLELTESIVMEESQAAIVKLRKLRRLGIHLSMDDFGTGYSSLSRLRHLPFDRLKVDRSFVSELGGNRDDAAIVHAIITLGKSLNMQVVAEGVETDAQLAQLHMENCDVAQGYYFGRPVPASDIGRQLGRYNPIGSIGLHAPRSSIGSSWQSSGRGETASAYSEAVN
jgi:diguanylate cyclase (GGDEF)-like protein